MYSKEGIDSITDFELEKEYSNEIRDVRAAILKEQAPQPDIEKEWYKIRLQNLLYNNVNRCSNKNSTSYG